VMIDKYEEITEILRELNRRSHLKHIFVSGSAENVEPLGKDRLERICKRLGQEIIGRGFTLVSGFGLGIGGAVALGALERIYAEGLSLERLSLFPFPQQKPEDGKRDDFYSQYRASMLSNSGFVLFISGNRNGSTTSVKDAPGVMEEFDIACRLGKIPIPFGASGWAAQSIWKKVSEQPNAYYGAKNVSAELKILGENDRTDSEYIATIFKMIEELSR
jgi:hypothetical protein